MVTALMQLLLLRPTRLMRSPKGQTENDYRSLTGLFYVANDPAENQPASSANTEIEIPSTNTNFRIVPLTAINLAWLGF